LGDDDGRPIRGSLDIGKMTLRLLRNAMHLPFSRGARSIERRPRS
jgi:hypothetical protein